MADETPEIQTPAQISGLADDKMRFWLAFTTIILISMFFGAAYFWAPKLPGDTEGLIIGGMLTWMGMILGYYFGSSSQSKSKDATIHSLQNGNGSNTNV